MQAAAPSHHKSAPPGISPRPPALVSLIELSTDTAQPMYQQLERQLIALIENGTIAPGTTLPAERRLAEDLA